MFTTFTDRDGKYQLLALAESGVRSARAHLPLHAHRGGAPHVRRRDGRRARSCSARAELMRARTRRTTCAARAGSTSTTHPALHELLVLGLARPLRRGGVLQRAPTTSPRAEGPPRRSATTSTCCSRARPPMERPAARDRIVEREERAAVSRSTRGCATPTSRTASGAIDKWNRLVADLGIHVRAAAPAPASTGRSARSRAQVLRSRGPPARRGEVGRARARVAAVAASDQEYVQSLMALRDGAGQVRELDRAPAHGINGQPVDFEYVRFNEA